MSKTPGTRTASVMETIRARVVSRALISGDRLPSVRGFAAKMGVSPSTVVEAYDRLAAEGLIRARAGSGFYVSAPAAPLVLADTAPNLDRAIDPFWVSRQSLDTDTNIPKPGCGWLPAEWMPNEAIRRAIRSLAKAEASILSDYGVTRGPLALRRLLARQFSEESLAVTPDQILLSGSGTQAIDLICRFFLRPGDTVLVDDPCYFNFQALLRAHQATIVSVPYTPTGPDVDCFAETVESKHPRLYITNSALHNPTGATLSPQTAHRLLNIATSQKMIVVEDDIFAGFESEPSPRLATLDGLSSVIRIGSFSKTLSASIRCGYSAARPDWIEALIDLQVETSFGGVSPVAAELVFSALSDGSYRKHLEELRRKLNRVRRTIATKLEALGVQPWLMPHGGFYLWCRLPGGRDAGAVAHAALRDGVILAPGNVFSASQTASEFMRFNVAQMNSAHIFTVLERALKPETNACTFTGTSKKR